MSWLIKALSSSVGKKFVMGATGLLLSGFLVAHLLGNFLLFAGDEAYNEYAHALHKQEALLMVAETGLFALFIAHIYLAVQLTRENMAARRVAYARKETKRGERILKLSAENWMFISGSIVLGFLVLHLIDFKFEVRPDMVYEGTGVNGETLHKEPFDKAVMLLQNPVTFTVYLIGSLILGVHLSHGFASAFQSLGLNHAKYNSCIKWLGVAFAIVVAIGFASFPIWAIGFEHPAP